MYKRQVFNNLKKRFINFHDLPIFLRKKTQYLLICDFHNMNLSHYGFPYFSGYATHSEFNKIEIKEVSFCRQLAILNGKRLIVYKILLL